VEVGPVDFWEFSRFASICFCVDMCVPFLGCRHLGMLACSAAKPFGFTVQDGDSNPNLEEWEIACRLL
jgi:hypothetical protein